MENDSGLLSVRASGCSWKEVNSKVEGNGGDFDCADLILNLWHFVNLIWLGRW